jgi:hypothetical protein
MPHTAVVGRQAFADDVGMVSVCADGRFPLLMAHSGEGWMPRPGIDPDIVGKGLPTYAFGNARLLGVEGSACRPKPTPSTSTLPLLVGKAVPAVWVLGRFGGRAGVRELAIAAKIECQRGSSIRTTSAKACRPTV